MSHSGRSGPPHPPGSTCHEYVPHRTGRQDHPEGLLWEPSPRWVRGRKDDTTVVDSRHPVLVWEPGIPVPLYAFPHDEVREDLLRPAKNPPTGTHTGSRIFYDLVIGGESTENAAWTYPADDLAGHIAFEWFRRVGRGLDHWYEEEEEIFIHPRDPHKRVDAIPSSRHVRVEIHGTVVADTHRPVLVFETGLPTRYYIPRETSAWTCSSRPTTAPAAPTRAPPPTGPGATRPVLPPSRRTSSGPIRGPLPAVGAVRDLLAFYNEAVDIVVDGDPLERPVTPFTHALPEQSST